MAANSNTKKVKIALIGGGGRMGTLVTELAGNDPDVEIALDTADVVIDFSSPEGTKKAIALQKPLVCGTTGLSEDILEELQALSHKVPVLYAPNFSIGIALLQKCLHTLLPFRQLFSSIEIEETHHIHKKDAPSGTSLALAQILQTDQIQSHREKDVVGIHKISLHLPHETLTITHDAHSRKIFAQGALAAAKFIFNKPPKLYSLTDIYS